MNVLYNSLKNKYSWISENVRDRERYPVRELETTTTSTVAPTTTPKTTTVASETTVNILITKSGELIENESSNTITVTEAVTPEVFKTTTQLVIPTTSPATESPPTTVAPKTTATESNEPKTTKPNPENLKKAQSGTSEKSYFYYWLALVLVWLVFVLVFVCLQNFLMYLIVWLFKTVCFCA